MKLLLYGCIYDQPLKLSLTALRTHNTPKPRAEHTEPDPSVPVPMGPSADILGMKNCYFCYCLLLLIFNRGQMLQ